MRAKVVSAEAEVTLAIADAFRRGNIAVMDLHRMQNVQADTEMRSAIAEDRDFVRAIEEVEPRPLRADARRVPSEPGGAARRRYRRLRPGSEREPPLVSAARGIEPVECAGPCCCARCSGPRCRCATKPTGPRPPAVDWNPGDLGIVKSSPVSSVTVAAIAARQRGRAAIGCFSRKGRDCECVLVVRGRRGRPGDHRRRRARRAACSPGRVRVGDALDGSWWAMNLVRARDVMGLPVVSIATGEDLAEVRDVVYDGEAQRLVGFTLNKRGMFAGRLKTVLAAEMVAAIGPDAVMIADGSALAAAGGASDGLDHLGAARAVIGNRVLSATGDDLGKVVAVILSTGDVPRAVGYEVQSSDRADTAFVPISAQMALSGENLVLPAAATAFVRNDLAGFGAAIATYRSPDLEEER